MKISKSTIIRTIAVFIVAINILLERFGYDLIPTDENKIAMFVEVALEIIAIFVAWWKNNSYSPAAIKADEFMKNLKTGEAEWSYEPDCTEECEEVYEEYEEETEFEVTPETEEYTYESEAVL